MCLKIEFRDETWTWTLNIDGGGVCGSLQVHAIHKIRTRQLVSDFWYQNEIRLFKSQILCAYVESSSSD